jgi:hypothetical protein
LALSVIAVLSHAVTHRSNDVCVAVVGVVVDALVGVEEAAVADYNPLVVKSVAVELVARPRKFQKFTFCVNISTQLL